MIFSRELLLASSQGKFDPITFSYTGSPQEWVVPVGIKQIQVDCIGAGGGADTTYGGKGGRVQCILSVKPEQLLRLSIGGMGNINIENSSNGGWNGGGAGGCNGSNYTISGKYPTGGGASDIRIGGTALSNRTIVSGGGGGGTSTPNTNFRAYGGNGGGLVGGNGNCPYNQAVCGKGGTQSSGGAAGTDRIIIGSFVNASPGILGQGGIGQNFPPYVIGGGGGGGYYGGGGANMQKLTFGFYAGAGGGGSSYTHPVLCTNVIHTQGYSQATGNGWITISMV